MGGKTLIVNICGKNEKEERKVVIKTGKGREVIVGIPVKIEVKEELERGMNDELVIEIPAEIGREKEECIADYNYSPNMRIERGNINSMNEVLGLVELKIEKKLLDRENKFLKMKLKKLEDRREFWIRTIIVAAAGFLAALITSYRKHKTFENVQMSISNMLIRCL